MKERRTQLAKARFPFLPMRESAPAETVMDAQVCDFVNVGDQEEERRTVGVDGDPRGATGPAGEVSQFGGPACADLEKEGSLFPKLKAIGYRQIRNMSAK